ncbi:MAG: hypothetical protein Q9218_005821 [Villophora microphyllina]
MAFNRTSRQWLALLISAFFFRGTLQANSGSKSNSTATSPTQVGISTRCDAYAYADTGDTCNEMSQRFHITLAQLTTWNPVLGYPDGGNCTTQFWAGYDYCVGVTGNPVSVPTASTSSPPGATNTVGGKPVPTLDSDGSDSSYVVGDVNCLDDTDEFYTECWEKLDVVSWLPQWYIKEPRCQSAQSELGCNIYFPEENNVEAWTTTFLREATGGGGADCTRFGGNSVLDFFNSWYTAIETALPMAGEEITAIIDLIDTNKPKKTHVGLNVALSALSIGLSFIPVVGEVAGVSALGIATANLAISGMKKAPGVAQQVWPIGMEDPTQPQEADNLTVQSSYITQSLQTNMQNGLAIVQGVNQGDVSSFLAFAGPGDFSTSQRNNPAPSVASIKGDQVQPLLLAYTSYLVSTTLAQNGWHVLMLPGIDPARITQTPDDSTIYPSWVGDHAGENDLQCSDYDQYGQCSGSYWWYSKIQNTAYTLNHDDRASSADILHTIFISGWATGPLLFENAAICEFQNLLRAVPSIQNSSVNYTTSFGQVGFTFQGTLPDLSTGDYTLVDPSSSTYFIPINGSGLPHLSEKQAYADLLGHPDTGLWAFDAQGIDFSCTSQLDVRVANSWGKSWTANSP